MALTDVLIVTVADYPNSDRVLRPLPGVQKDNVRVRNWLQRQPDIAGIRDVCWPPAGSGTPSELWSASKVEDEVKILANRATANSTPRDRLFVYFSGHGQQKPTRPAFPALYCALHKRSMPDLFPSYFWLPALTVLPAYREYLFFLDCCNDDQTDPLPPEPNIRLDVRTDTPSVLLVTAAKAGQQAYEDDGRGGVFTGVLLEALSGSAGSPDSDVVTAQDLVDYLKAVVPLRAKEKDPTRTQCPLEWSEGQHTPLRQYEIFRRQKVSGVDVGHLLNGHDPASIDILKSDFRPLDAAATLTRGANGAVILGDIYPGQYLLKDRLDDTVVQAVRIRTPVADDGSVTAIAESVPLS